MPSHFWFNSVWLALHWNAATCETQHRTCLVGSVLTVNCQSLCACCLDLYFVVCLFSLIYVIVQPELKKKTAKGKMFQREIRQNKLPFKR
jgi:hypothetical protein